MAGRQASPKQSTIFAVGAAMLFVLAWHANPATASSNTPVRCDDVAESALEIPAHEFKATSVNHETEVKRVEENVATPVNDKKTEEGPIAEDPVSAGEKVPAVHARVPGVSDDELARYKRRMYRTDI